VTSFRVLGPVEAWTDERRLVLGGPQQVKLLAFLLLNANRAVSADAVTDAVWGSQGGGTAKRLQMGVLRLRRALAPLDGEDKPRVRTVGHGYMLSVRSGELDAEAFSERVRDGHRALGDGDPGRASDCWPKRWSCGADRLSPMSRSRTSPKARSADWRSSG